MEEPQCKILALAIRASRLGFAAIEQDFKLIDWGMTFYQQSSMSQMRAAKLRLDSLVTDFNPSVIVVATSELAASREALTVRSIMRSLRDKAHARSITIESISRKDIRDAFHEITAKSKDEIASAIVKLFPELHWKLPSKRRIWEKEHFRMTLFDAVAGGITVWRRLFDIDATQ